MYGHSAYGKLVAVDVNTGQDAGESMGACRFIGYTGQMRDAESGLWHYRNRYLDPLSSRFLQRDEAGYADGLNMYAYVRNNPLKYTDPDGRTARWKSNILDMDLGLGFRDRLAGPSVTGLKLTSSQDPCLAVTSFHL